MAHRDDAGSIAGASQQAISLEEGTRPLIGGEQSHSARRTHYAPMDVGSQFEKVKGHLTHLRQQRLFIYMTILAATMILINIIQAALIDHLHSHVWVTVFPGAVFAAALVAIGVNAQLSRKTLMPEWKKAEVPRRIAWAGIVVSMFLPIVLCQFIYMPAVAVPAWHKAKWTTDIKEDTTALYPGVVISTINDDPSSGIAVILSQPQCRVQGPLLKEEFSCAASNVQTASVSGASVSQDSYQYSTFNPLGQPNVTVIEDIVTSAGIILYVPVNYNSSVPTDGGLPFLQVGLYDPQFPFSLEQFALGCGSPPFYYSVTVELTNSTILHLTPQRTLFSDSAKVLPDQHPDPGQLGSCSTKNNTRQEYIYYDAQSDIVSQDSTGLANSSCDLASANFNDKVPCGFYLGVTVRSDLLTTITSSHGTTALQILIDEGGIIGGILFFTWFFSIFVV